MAHTNHKNFGDIAEMTNDFLMDIKEAHPEMSYSEIYDAAENPKNAIAIRPAVSNTCGIP